MEDLQRLSKEEFKEKTKIPLCLVLDDIRSMANVGSIFRTSDGFRVDKIFLCGITATPPHREIEKTALGATESVAWEYAENALTLVDDLKKQGYTILALEQTENSTSLLDFNPVESKYALVLGNEVFGVNQDIVNSSDSAIEIPQFGTKHSFNVSIAASIFLWDYFTKTTGKVLV